jgi:ketosteroid isomerase-like protein
MPNFDALVAFYENLSAADVERFGAFYAEDATFKDPFNEVRGLAAIQRIFAHMFRQVEAPRFRVGERIAADNGVVLVWTFHFRSRHLAGGAEQVLRGVSHLRFDAAGKVIYHRDYWDAAEELYMKLPAIGCLMRGLRRMVAA